MNYVPRFASSFIERSFAGGGGKRHGHFTTHYGELFLMTASDSAPPNDTIAESITFEIVRRIFSMVNGENPRRIFYGAVQEVSILLKQMSSDRSYFRGLTASLAAVLLSGDDPGRALLCCAGRIGLYLARDGEWIILSGGLGEKRDNTGTPPICASEKKLRPDTRWIEIVPGDRFIMASDTVYRGLSMENLMECSNLSPREAADLLLLAVRDDHGRERMVVQVFDIENCSDVKRTVQDMA